MSSPLATSFATLVAGAKVASRAITDAMNLIAEAARTAGRGLAGMRVQIVQIKRAQHGQRNFTGDGLWQSDLCGAWIHDSCPLPVHCDCTCHGGSLR